MRFVFNLLAGNYALYANKIKLKNRTEMQFLKSCRQFWVGRLQNWNDWGIIYLDVRNTGSMDCS